MRHLLDLPVEIIIWIYQSLDDIDDALHLARSCKYLNSVFNPLNIREKIFRSIIDNAPQHVYDILLCHRIGLHEHFSKTFYTRSPAPRRSSHRREIFTKYMSSTGAGKDIAPEVVWEVVCRWHAMRLAFDLYCDSTVQTSFSLSTFPYMPRNGVDENEEALAREDPLPNPLGTNCESFDQLNASQKQNSYRRFYRALTAHWLAVEALWLTRAQVYETAKDCDKSFDVTWTMWTDNPTRTIQDKLDIIEVVDFVWGFLGRKIFHVSSVPAWLEGEDQHIQIYLEENETEASNWLFFVHFVAQYLRPPHIMELLLLSTWSSQRSWKLDRPGYLRRLGFFDVQDGIIEHGNPLGSADTYLPATAVEEDVENGLRAFAETGTSERNEMNSDQTASEGVTELMTRWENYRRVAWPSDARTKVLFRDETSQDIVWRIMNKQQD